MKFFTYKQYNKHINYKLHYEIRSCYLYDTYHLSFHLLFRLVPSFFLFIFFLMLSVSRDNFGPL